MVPSGDYTHIRETVTVGEGLNDNDWHSLHVFYQDGYVGTWGASLDLQRARHALRPSAGHEGLYARRFDKRQTSTSNGHKNGVFLTLALERRVPLLCIKSPLSSLPTRNAMTSSEWCAQREFASSCAVPTWMRSRAVLLAQCSSVAVALLKLCQECRAKVPRCPTAPCTEWGAQNLWMQQCWLG